MAYIRNMAKEHLGKGTPHPRNKKSETKRDQREETE